MPNQYFSRLSLFGIFPAGFLGKVSTNSKDLGALKPAGLCLQKSTRSCSVSFAPLFKTTPRQIAVRSVNSLDRAKLVACHDKGDSEGRCLRKTPMTIASTSGGISLGKLLGIRSGFRRSSGHRSWKARLCLYSWRREIPGRGQASGECYQVFQQAVAMWVSFVLISSWQ
jgi:hypothetical protein